MNAYEFNSTGDSRMLNTCRENAVAIVAKKAGLCRFFPVSSSAYSHLPIRVLVIFLFLAPTRTYLVT